MHYIKVKNTLYPMIGNLMGRACDTELGQRSSRAFTLSMTHEDAAALFVNGLEWYLVYQEPSYTNDQGETITPDPIVHDNTEFCVAGPITDNRNGTVTVKMGVTTAEEALAILTGGT